jgi:hypothetical protein
VIERNADNKGGQSHCHAVLRRHTIPDEQKEEESSAHAGDDERK